MHKRDNAAFDRSADFTGDKTLLPVSINLSLFPRLHWSKESRSPSLTFTNSLVTVQPAKKRRVLDDDDDDEDIEAEIGEIENGIRLLSEKLEALRTKKAKKELRAAISNPFETAAAATGCKKKRADLSVNSAASCCRRQGGGLGQSGKGGKPPIDKRRKPPAVKVPEKGGSLGEPAAGKRPEKSESVEVFTKRKRRKWSLPPENCRKGFPFYTEQS